MVGSGTRAVVRGAEDTRMCPRDESAMAREPRDALLRTVQVDVCPKCEGLFLDKGEVKSLTGHANLHKLLTKYLGFDTDSALHCPECGNRMDGEDVAGTRLDVCIKCYGVWLDPGEIDKLRSLRESDFKKFTPEKLDEIRRAKRIAWEERDEAFRASFRHLVMAKYKR